MRSLARLLIWSGLVLTGCSAARDVAVTSFRVLDAPANFLRRRINPPEKVTVTTRTTETARVSDVSTPGRPVATPSPAATKRAPAQTTTSSTRKPALSATPRPKPIQTVQFPIAKPVPGKPGYVYSVDPKGGIVDVTGYKAGDKAKDPYTQQIFVVP